MSGKTRGREGGCMSGGMREGDGEGGFCLWRGGEGTGVGSFCVWTSLGGYQLGLQVIYMIH